MSLPHEFLPATTMARQNLVLLHGWGMNREVWRPLLGLLRPWANVTLLDLPGCAPGVAQGGSGELQALLPDILSCCPERAVYVGWSLGGQIGMQLAGEFPERVAGVVTLCSNPRFVAEDDWPGMGRQLFDGFRQGVATGPATALRRFDSLQAQGANDPRQRLRELQKLRREPAGECLLTGLDWLAQLDQRQSWAELSTPRLHLFADRDALVPANCVQALANLQSQQSKAQIRSIEECGHLLPLEASEQLAAEIHRFLDTAGLLGAREKEPVETVAKAAVADSFSRAAGSYDSVAHLQRDVGERLLSRLDGLSCRPQTVLDLGCGTGYFRSWLQARYPEVSYIGMDIAEGMVQFARSDEDGQWLVGDAEALPFAAGSVDLVFSSLALQWCFRPGLLLAELARILSPGGSCVFSTLGPETLRELRSSWAAVDSHRHVNSFLPGSALDAAAGDLPDLTLALDSEEICLRYGRVRDLLDELKALGAHNMNRGRQEGLTGRRALQGMLAAYEGWREDGQLPATYEVIYGVMRKT